MDSRQAFEWISRRDMGRIRHNNLIEECRALLNRNWTMKLELVLRESNRVADGMSKRRSPKRERILQEVAPPFQEDNRRTKLISVNKKT